MTTETAVDIPQGHRRGVQFGANWTLLTSPYLIVAFAIAFAIGGAPVITGDLPKLLEIAGTSPLVFGATVMLDAIFHAVFFVTAVTLFAVLRKGWPIRASLILVAGTWQMVLGLTKGLSSLFTFTRLGTAYVEGNAQVMATLLPVASGEYGLRLALQAMDGFGVIVIWGIVSLLPAAIRVPRAARWLGWILTAALLAATPEGPTFLLVAILFPVWLFLIGRWMRGHLPAS